MAAKQLRTANFSDDDRERLGEAVKSARREAGFRSRRTFADAAGIGKRSVDAVELFEPSVGEDVLEAIGRTLGRYLADWSADTPRAILEDKLTPANIRRQDESAASDETEPDPGDYSDLEEYLRAVIKNLRRQGVSREVIDRAVAKVLTELEQAASEAERNGPETPRGQVG